MKHQKKVTIAKGTSKERKVPQRYVPKGLSKEDKKKQEKSIVEGKKRPKVETFKSKRSGFTERFEKKYGKKLTDVAWIDKNLLKREGQKQVKAKGMGAYYSSGSRPNQSPQSWSLARLASVLMGGPARKVDRAIWDKYKVNK
jgi:hypothetical protein